MLKKKAFRRIFITTIIFFIVFVVLSIKKLEGPTNIYESNNYKTDFLENIYTLNDDNLVSKTSIYVNKELNTLEKVKVLIETMIKENNNNSLLPTYFNPILQYITCRSIFNEIYCDNTIFTWETNELLSDLPTPPQRWLCLHPPTIPSLPFEQT